ncbi:SepM family pheromone-processing serine protease [Lysinibacillus odysseyi]|uniref:endopeptidase La n=1 Tax=Lysinibacillus odysseyi 34hs-1 = NBRC 100172 TaxID=1220589 RepID=A0A0A3IGV9_9BACI|nr:SepM family pheromone-processing serine protease [Lysinibacillus odysseyi]KGR84001.1 peptidase [Lysinibacillus odysseyi 34hs-1 = NBRC 100172]
MKKSNLPYLITIFIGILLAGFLVLYPLNLYVMKPGHAYNVSEYVNVQNGDQDDEGSFSLMTVSMSKATPLTYIYAKFKDYYELLYMDQVRQEEEDDEEYNVRQLKLMTDSQFNALYVAFSRAHLDYQVTFKGVYVLNIITGGAADGLLKAGDEIVEIDGERIESQQMLAEGIEKKQAAGQKEIELVVNRDGKLLTKMIKLKEIPGSDGRVGLGIVFTESKSIKTDPKVNIHTESIGGPSAGLMFTLEVLNQLLDEDLTKGYTIAGTGEMLEDGTVGRIGGIEKKVVAADKAGMEIFFAPDDEVTEEVRKKYPDYISNYEAAVKTAKEIGTTMKIVPVKTVDDAIDYLDKLQPKS